MLRSEEFLHAEHLGGKTPPTGPEQVQLGLAKDHKGRLGVPFLNKFKFSSKDPGVQAHWWPLTPAEEVIEATADAS